MRPTIQAHGFQLSQALRTHTELRVATALGWASEHMRQLDISLSDINGPRGGVDKRCRIHVLLGGGREVIIEDVEADLYVAINRAADRAGRTIVRQIQRRRDFSHQRPAPVELSELSHGPEANAAGSIR
ncbi:HPF/RaiA family ribosome-associated protein [Massilia sp. S19_KUP03_FR1]|uniref:HPF/RaiA family ribosome-associated protein n=1 Tax=Massilia sp. S19_KUP03_FR1 TaxID=3025503 RepID=UPI002FCDDDFF